MSIKEITEAILAGDTPAEDFGAMEVPASYRGVVVRKDETGMFDGLASPRQGPAQVAAHRRGADP